MLVITRGLNHRILSPSRCAPKGRGSHTIPESGLALDVALHRPVGWAFTWNAFTGGEPRWMDSFTMENDHFYWENHDFYWKIIILTGKSMIFTGTSPFLMGK